MNDCVANIGGRVKAGSERETGCFLVPWERKCGGFSPTAASFFQEGSTLLTVGEPRAGGRETANASASIPLEETPLKDTPSYVLLQLHSQKLEAEKAGKEIHLRGWRVEGRGRRGQGWRQHLAD